MTLPPVSDLDTLDERALATAMKPLWEDAGWLAARLAGRRFGSWDEVIDCAEAEIGAASTDERAGLLSGHPRLGAEKVSLKAASPMSWAEQGGDHSPGGDTNRRLAELNDAYEAKFGFPFVCWVGGRPLEAIVPVLEARLGRGRADEISTGCAALVSIARDRLAKLRSTGEPDEAHKPAVPPTEAHPTNPNERPA